MKAARVNTWWYIFLLSGIVVLTYLTFPPSEADAVTLEEIQTLQEEQKTLQDEIEILKQELVDNQNDIIQTEDNINIYRNELGILKNANADPDRIFAQEKLLADEIITLRVIKLDRTDLLEEHSQKVQRANLINDELRYDVESFDDTPEVELITSENINLQIQIDEVQKQLVLLDEVLESIDDEKKHNEDQIRQYKNFLEQYEMEHERIKEESKSGWTAISGLKASEQLVTNMESIVTILESQKDSLEDDKVQINNEKRTLENILEEANQELEANNVDLSKQKKLVGIQIANSCKVLHKYNITTTCPTYKELYLHDSSNTEISGEFVTDDDGWFHRGPSNYAESWRWYDHDEEIRLIVDPPQGMAQRMPMITITNNFGIYFAPEDKFVGDESITKYHEGRYIDDCRGATISSDHWKRMLTDTINMLRTDCEGSTIQDVFIRELPRTNIDVTSSPNWQYTQWLNSTIEQCKTICKQY